MGTGTASAASCSKFDWSANPPDTMYKGSQALQAARVCSYSSPAPTGTVGTATQSCLCKTVRCKVLVKEDKGASDDIRKKDKYKACDFIVRIEDTHTVASVPGDVMWVIFGASIFIAGSVSGFFILLYGNKPHGGEKEEDEGSNE